MQIDEERSAPWTYKEHCEPDALSLSFIMYMEWLNMLEGWVSPLRKAMRECSGYSLLNEDQIGNGSPTS